MDPRSGLKSAPVTELAGGSGASVSLTEIDGRPVVVKRYPRAAGLAAFKDCFRPAAPTRAARAAEALRTAGLPAATVLSLQVDRSWPWPRGGVLVMEAAPGLDATEFLRASAGAVRPRRVFASALGALIARLHASGLVHGDLAPGNVVVDGGGARLVLVDFDGLRLHQRSTARRRLADLARLGARFTRTRSTRGDRVRFLRAYLAALGRDPAEWRALWRTVAPLAADRLRAWGWA